MQGEPPGQETTFMAAMRRLQRSRELQALVKQVEVARLPEALQSCKSIPEYEHLVRDRVRKVLTVRHGRRLQKSRMLVRAYRTLKEKWDCLMFQKGEVLLPGLFPPTLSFSLHASV